MGPCHKAYWLGYNASTFGDWVPVDKTLPSNLTANYTLWGQQMPDYYPWPYLIPNAKVQMMCVAANGSDPLITINSTWSWNNQFCSVQMPAMCRVMRGWRCRGPWLPCAPASVPRCSARCGRVQLGSW
jgi:hypothetical protein